MWQCPLIPIVACVFFLAGAWMQDRHWRRRCKDALAILEVAKKTAKKKIGDEAD